MDRTATAMELVSLAKELVADDSNLKRAYDVVEEVLELSKKQGWGNLVPALIKLGNKYPDVPKRYFYVALEDIKDRLEHQANAVDMAIRAYRE